MNFERARKHSLIAQFIVHVDTNIGLVVPSKYNNGVATAWIPIAADNRGASKERSHKQNNSRK